VAFFGAAVSLDDAGRPSATEPGDMGASPQDGTGPTGVYFRAADFRSTPSGASVPEELWDNLQTLISALDVVRAQYGAPIIVHSGYRTAADNAASGGVDQSQHKYARASDLRPLYGDAESLRNLIVRLISAGKIPAGYVKLYNAPSRARKFVHYDVRGTYIDGGSEA